MATVRRTAPPLAFLIHPCPIANKCRLMRLETAVNWGRAGAAEKLSAIFTPRHMRVTSPCHS
jgi:hypothetical protein